MGGDAREDLTVLLADARYKASDKPDRAWAREVKLSLADLPADVVAPPAEGGTGGP